MGRVGFLWRVGTLVLITQRPSRGTETLAITLKGQTCFPPQSSVEGQPRQESCPEKLHRSAESWIFSPLFVALCFCFVLPDLLFGREEKTRCSLVGVGVGGGVAPAWRCRQ